MGRICATRTYIIPKVTIRNVNWRDQDLCCYAVKRCSDELLTFDEKFLPYLKNRVLQLGQKISGLKRNDFRCLVYTTQQKRAVYHIELAVSYIRFAERVKGMYSSSPWNITPSTSRNAHWLRSNVVQTKRNIFFLIPLRKYADENNFDATRTFV